MEQNGSKLYAFDAQEFEVTFNARPLSDNPAWITHKLRRPTLEELQEWERKQTYETVEVSKRESQVIADDEGAAARLWEKLIIEVKGYDFGDGKTDEWRTLSDEEKKKLRFNHKTTTINGLYRSSCSLESATDDDSPSPFSDTWRIRQEIGSPENPYIVVHELREPGEAEKQRFRRTSASTNFVRGSKKQHIKVATNLKAYIELYDALIQRVEGATETHGMVQDIDPIFKRQVISTLMDALDTQLQD